MLARPGPRRLHRELIPVGPGESLVARRFVVDDLPFHWHQHPELELTLIVRGRGLRAVGDAVAEFGPGDCLLLGAELPHTWATHEGGGPLESLVIQFGAGLLGRQWLEAAEARPLAALFAAAARGVDCTGLGCGEEVAEVVAAPPGPVRLARLLAVLARIAAQPHLKWVARGAWTAPRADEERWARVLAIIHERAAAPLTQRAVAQRVGLSPSSFARGFRRRLGCTFRSYLAQVRIGIAARLLLESPRPVAAVAQAAGFANLAAFNRRFRAAHGCTPRAFRARGTHLDPA